MDVLPAHPNTTQPIGSEPSRKFNIGLVLHPLTDKKRAGGVGLDETEIKVFLVRLSVWVDLADEMDDYANIIIATKFLTSVAFECAIDILAPDTTNRDAPLRKRSNEKSITASEPMATHRHVYTEVSFTYDIVNVQTSKGTTKDVLSLLTGDGGGENRPVEKLLRQVLQRMMNELGGFNQRFCGRTGLEVDGCYVARNTVCIRGDGTWKPLTNT